MPSNVIASWATGNHNLTIPPQNFTFSSSNVVYRDTLRRWILILKVCVEVDTKRNAMLRSLGHLITIMCDGLVKELLKQKEKSGTLNRDGDEGDHYRTALMEEIKETIAKYNPK